MHHDMTKASPAPSPLPWKTNRGKSLFSGSKQVALMRASNSGWLNNQPCASEEEANANAEFTCQAVNSHAAHLALIEELQTALEEMGCSELLDCEQPQTRGSKHAKNCDWEIAMKALAKSRAALEGK